MTTALHPRQLSRLERASLGFAGALMLVSAATLAGWWLWVDELLQPFGAFSPLEVSAALGFASLGAALWAAESRLRLASALATVGPLLGAVTLLEYLLQRNLGVDRLLAAGRSLVVEAHPGRMAATVATCLVIAGLLLLWRFSGRLRTVRLPVQAGLGSLLAAGGLATLLGYGADLPHVYQWGMATAVPPVAGVALMILGLALVLLAWRENLNTHGDAPSWSALPAVIIGLTLTLILWLGLRSREQNFMAQHTLSQLDKFFHQAEDHLDKQIAQTERLARLWGDAPDGGRASRDADAAALMKQGSAELGCVSVTSLDTAGQLVWSYPVVDDAAMPPAASVLDPERRAALERALAGGGQPAVTLEARVPGTSGPEAGFVIYAPVYRAGRATGAVAAEFSARKFFHVVTTSRARIDDHYHVTIAANGVTLFQNAPSDATRLPALAAERTQAVAGHRLRVGITPSETTLAQTRRFLPELAFAAGFGLTALLGLSVQLARSARAGQRAAELSNEKLHAENVERRRIEDRLKVSDERLRLALDATHIGIFERAVISGHVYYSPGLWAMLGYEQMHMPSTVDAWQSLIHPDDMPHYRGGTEAQLTGALSFIEAEYRVRARNGDWRWVYTRSKSVATTADSRPTRIIGTVQDITARREAEIALRASQAEARKLSLVAAKTESPVLIASPDGRIEWVNEAFCRVMEFTRDEVVGRHPVHFMDGPDTNPRTITRIRAAMARGVGISTDVVNYSKSGRKYHLHLEIQPVRTSGGDVEHFIAVETDVTARVETEDQLRRAKAEADDASRAKSEFLASMSHEIRTPMNGVIGMTSLLMDTTLSAEQTDYVNTIRTSGEALLTIINDILDFSKIESGKMELERSPFELSLCLEEALDLFALQASAKRLELGYLIAPDVPTWLIGDATRLRQVIVNLVNNAVKFTPSGSVSVEVRNQPPLTGIEIQPRAADADFETARLEFRVRDTGIGIPPERMARLFKAFSQVDSSTTRKYGGTGLGLAISQRLCQLMGGDIRVESDQTRGTEIIFTLATEIAPSRSDSGLSSTPDALRGGWVLCVEDHPVTQARLRALFATWSVECVVVADAPAAVALAAGRAKAPALLVFDAGDSPDEPAPLDTLTAIRCPRLALYPFGRTAPIPPSDGQPFASTSKPLRTISFILSVSGLFQSAAQGSLAASLTSDRPMGVEIPLEVLIAEDNAVNQKVALRLLERLGYRADAVANGLEAVTTLENRRYDLVLMDLQMPEMDGFEATRQIRQRLPATRQPKIVALTANAMQGDRDLCFAAGMDDYISKPVKIHEIADAIRRQFVKPAAAPTTSRQGN
ncbi:response regulator [Horticoccus sp. 23ND18S-11]|uniref:response regulator n=1 Tax=Horticoccus sp. 23ND18S-11 TaxID=3391832 RepID=UPI0039C92A30